MVKPTNNGNHGNTYLCHIVDTHRACARVYNRVTSSIVHPAIQTMHAQKQIRHQSTSISLQFTLYSNSNVGIPLWYPDISTPRRPPLPRRRNPCTPPTFAQKHSTHPPPTFYRPPFRHFSPIRYPPQIFTLPIAQVIIKITE